MSANFLICAPSTMPLMAVGSEFRECAKCGTGIMIAPSGLILLAEQPNFDALCMRCGAEQLNQETGPVQFMGAASPEVLAEEVQSAVPNERCSR